MSIIKKRLIPLVIVAVCLTAGVVFAQSIPKEQVQGLPAAIAQIVLLQQQVAAQQLQINDLQAQLAAIGDPDEIASLVKRTQYFDVDEVKKVTYLDSNVVVGGKDTSYNTIDGDHNFVVGGSNDIYGSESVVVGQLNKIGDAALEKASIGDVAIGTRQKIIGHYDSILGGQFNTIDSTESASGSADGSVIMGGSQNKITAEMSSIGGGFLNEAKAGSSTISAGNANKIESGANYATVSGGKYNLIKATAVDSSIGGGDFVTQETANKFKAKGEVLPP